MMACIELGCTRHYAMHRGYVDIRERRIDDSRVVRKLCKKRSHEALAIIAIVYGEPLWQCLDDECLQGTGANGATVRVGDVVLAEGHGPHRFKIVGIDDSYATLRLIGEDGAALAGTEHFMTRIPVSHLVPYPLKAAV